jgi:meso-butanediol dehydrogenase / (S,S)-butanediol dehydrogenase / diacetyl reductase
MRSPRRVGIVTGGGTGIGAAIARRLAGTGAAVALVGRRADRLASSAAAIEEAGGQALPVVGDVSQEGEAERIVGRVLSEWRRIDVLVNNAAYIRNLPLESIDEAEFELHFRTNLLGPLLLTQAALPSLRQSTSPAVVNVSSSSASLAIPTQLMYGATKSALEFATRLLAAELAPHGVRVNAIAPGPTETDIHLLWASDMATARTALKGAVPLGYMGQPDDIARWVEYLTNPDETFITGAIIPVDGGQTLNGWKSSIGSAAR